MVKHIVMWKLKEFGDGESKTENAKRFKKKLVQLKNKIGEIKSIEVGININPTKASYDVVLVSEFETSDNLVTYQKHPAHLKLIEFLERICDKKTVVDYIV